MFYFKYSKRSVFFFILFLNFCDFYVKIKQFKYIFQQKNKTIKLTIEEPSQKLNFYFLNFLFIFLKLFKVVHVFHLVLYVKLKLYVVTTCSIIPCDSIFFFFFACSSLYLTFFFKFYSSFLLFKKTNFFSFSFSFVKNSENERNKKQYFA